MISASKVKFGFFAPQVSLGKFGFYMILFVLALCWQPDLIAQNNDLTFSAPSVTATISNTCYARLDNSADLNSSSLTIEAWIYPTAWRPSEWQGSIINKEGPNSGYFLRCGNNGALTFGYGKSGGFNSVTVAASLRLNTWQHVAAVINGTNCYLYRNGVLVGTGTTPAAYVPSTVPLEIGRSYNDFNRYFIGKIDNTNLNIAQSEKDLARNEYYRTLKDYWLSYYRLRRTTLYDFEKQESLFIETK